MNIGKFDLKNEFSAVKKKLKKNVPGKKKKGPSRPQPKERVKQGSDPRRPLVFQVPVRLQTVIAVLICCGVLVVAGFAVFAVEQQEINSLKGDLKAYADDGVVPAGLMDSSVSLNIEAVAGRISALQKMIDSSADETLSNDELQWIGTELDEVFVESQILNEVLNDIEADKLLKTTYNDTVQSPLVTLQESYDALKVQDADVADTTVEDGAATDTGAFKSSGGLQTGTKWALVVVGILVVVGVILAFLFRRKIAAIFRRTKKTKPVSHQQKQVPRKEPSGGSSGKAAKPAVDTVVKHAAQPSSSPGEEISGKIPEEKVVVADDGETSTAVSASSEVDENEAFLDALAPAFRKLAEKERQKAEDGSDMIAPSTEDLMTFDDSVISLEEIEEEEDSLFTKQDDKTEK